jgi:hypothetical protein
MGWSVFSDYKTRDDMVRHIRRSLNYNGQVVRRSSAVGNTFWALVELPDGRGMVVARYLLQGSQPQCPGWAYKDVPHREGLDCPVDYLRKLAETTDVDELEWRDAVRAHHAGKVALKAQRANLEPGRVLTLAGKEYRLVEQLQRGRGWNVLCLADDKVYRMSVKQVNTALLALKEKDEQENQSQAQQEPAQEPRQALLL